MASKAQAAVITFLPADLPRRIKNILTALRRMVEHFYATSLMQILLLAYTNRAVDEICQSLSSITLRYRLYTGGK